MAINRRTAEDLAGIPLTGRIRMAGPLGQHRPAKEIRRGAPLSGINVFADGDYAVVALELPRRRTRASGSIRYSRVSSVAWKAAWATVPVASPTAMSSVSFGPRSSSQRLWPPPVCTSTRPAQAPAMQLVVPGALSPGDWACVS